MDRAGSIYRFNGAAVGANKIVTVLARNKKSEVSGTFMKAKTTDHTYITKPLKESKYGCFITFFCKMTARSYFGQRHRPVAYGEAGENGFESLGAAKPSLLGPFEELVV